VPPHVHTSFWLSAIGYFGPRLWTLEIRLGTTPLPSPPSANGAPHTSLGCQPQEPPPVKIPQGPTARPITLPSVRLVRSARNVPCHSLRSLPRRVATPDPVTQNQSWFLGSASPSLALPGRNVIARGEAPGKPPPTTPPPCMGGTSPIRWSITAPSRSQSLYLCASARRSRAGEVMSGHRHKTQKLTSRRNPRRVASHPVAGPRPAHPPVPQGTSKNPAAALRLRVFASLR